MIPEAAALLGLTQGWLWAAFVVFLRIGAMLSLVPAFGERSVPARVKLGLGLAFTLVVLPSVAPDLPPLPRDLWPALATCAPEVVTGLFFGMMLRLFVMALQVAGAVAAQSTSLSQIFGATVGVDPQPAIGNVLVVAGLALAALMGLHVRLAAYMIEGYALVGAGEIIGAGTLVEAGLGQIAASFALGFSLAAPFVVASLIYNVTLGVINRAMPQLMVAFVGAPAITAGGLALLALSAGASLGVWHDALARFLAAPFADLP